MGDSLPLEHVWVEPRVETDDPPAVIVLHGRGANEEDLLPLVEQLPDELAIVSLRAPDPLGPGYTWYGLDLSSGGLHVSQPDPDDFERSLELIGDAIDAAVEHYDLDPGRIGLLGFSQGAVLSLSVLIERVDTVAWVVALHGYLPSRYDESALQTATGSPVFIAAGTQDQIIPVTRAEEAAERLEAAGVDVTFRTYRIGHGTAPGEIADVDQWIQARLDRE